MSFGAWEYNPVRIVSSAWEELRVPALRRETIERLRALDADAFADTLAVVAELRIAENGATEIATQGEPLDPEQGVRSAPGVLQLRLTRGELADLEQRRQTLLARVEAGEIPLF